MKQSRTPPWDTPRQVPSPPFGELDYHWWYPNEDEDVATVFRTAATDKDGPVPLATVTRNPNGTELLAVAPDGTELLAGAGVHYLARLVVMMDVADRLGTLHGEQAAASRLNPTSTDTDTYRRCVALADDPDSWAEEFGLRTSMIESDELADAITTSVGFQDDDLDRLGVPDGSRDALRAQLLTLWDTAFQAARDTEMKRIATVEVRVANDTTLITVTYTVTRVWTATAAKYRRAMAAQLAGDSAELAAVHAADPHQLAGIVAASGAQLQELLATRPAPVGSEVQAFTVDTAEVMK